MGVSTMLGKKLPPDNLRPQAYSIAATLRSAMCNTDPAASDQANGIALAKPGIPWDGPKRFHVLLSQSFPFAAARQERVA
jgi:hypothetical protein